MIKVKYYDNIEPQEFEIEFETETEATEWIECQMGGWYETLCGKYQDADVTWLNRLLDVNNKTEIYIPGTSVSICCEIVNK